MKGITMKFRVIAATAALLLGSAGLAQAQSSAGHIQGVAAAGDTIQVKGVDSGFVREITVKEDGKYTMRRIPLGTYVVVRKHADGTVEAPAQIEIHTGVTVRLK
ncbi:MAG: carboxypeptidase regulatory-like domain-containing protein [Lysobacteraceae bacterium]|nr:MAG: carboxypeptidase regulatory-like domain-containing protein [Xanthomonadaceae bacterium]